MHRFFKKDEAEQEVFQRQQEDWQYSTCTGRKKAVLVRLSQAPIYVTLILVWSGRYQLLRHRRSALWMYQRRPERFPVPYQYATVTTCSKRR